jgi:DNA-binding NarL/FixJ family response regulator
MTEGLRVLLVDDHQLLVQSLALALRAEGYEAEVADLTDRDALIQHVWDRPPALVLLDLQLGGVIGDGSTLVRPFVQAGARVLVVSAATDRLRIASAIEQGAVGHISKAAPFDDLLEAARSAARGDEVMPEAQRHEMVTELRLHREREQAERAQFDRLTKRERQVLRELSNGKSVGAIASEWFVSEATVRTQVRGVLVKLGVGTQLEAVSRALRAGWLNDE